MEERLRELAPRDELELLMREATASVEKSLALEDAGWINLSGTTMDVISSAERITNIQLSRLYSTKDPLGKQSIRLWTDYTFGTGMVWSVDEDNKSAQKVIEGFWNNKSNQSVLGAQGQRKSSNKCLIDGEVFFALFLGASGEVKIRWIDPLEITEIITDPGDQEAVLFYKREWTDAQSQGHTEYYRSSSNEKGTEGIDSQGKAVQYTEDALVYHLSYNTISQRGNPLLLPALNWMKYYTKFLSSRIAVMLALAKFAWKTKVTGGQAQVDNIKNKTDGQEVNAGSLITENLGADTTPIKTETGASAAYQDGRMIKLQVCAAVGIPEQYFGDISIGNLATAKTVELPMLKMFQSYQAVWKDVYKDINEIVLAYNKIPETEWYVDMDFPPIAPEDVFQAAQALSTILTAIPDLAYSDDVKQMALMTIGVNDPAEVLAALSKSEESNPNIKLAKVLKQFRESLKE